MDKCYTITYYVNDVDRGMAHAIIRVKRRLDDAVNYLSQRTGLPCSAIAARYFHGNIDIAVDGVYYSVEEHVIEEE